MSRRKKSKDIGFCKRYAIFIRDDFTCVFCDKFYFPAKVYKTGRKRALGINHPLPAQVSKTDYYYECVLSLDHVIAVVNGGDNSDLNLVTACRACNARKGDTPWLQLSRPEQLRIIEAVARNYDACYSYVHQLMRTSGKSKLVNVHRHNQLIKQWKAQSSNITFLQFVGTHNASKQTAMGS